MLKTYFKLSLSTRILIWMVFGSVLGIIFGEKVLFLKPVGEIFLQLLIMAAIPLVFFNLLSGLSSIGSLKSFGKIGAKIFIYYSATTALAIAVGIVVMQISKAGEGMTLTGKVPVQLGQMPVLSTLLMDMVPSNIFASFAEGNLVQIVVFAVILGIAVLGLPEDKKAWFQNGFDRFAELMRVFIELILKASPLGLGALMAATFAEYGSGIAGALVVFIGTVYLGLAIMVGFYLLVVIWVGKIKPGWFLTKTAPLYATTMATCSSLASLAVSMDIAEKDLKLPKKIFSFTLPLGAQFNKDGTAVTLGCVIIFAAQAVGVQFSFMHIAQIVIVGLIISQGSAGVPGGGFVISMLFAEAFHLPLEIVAVVGGIYRLIDMGNTTINCMGDMVATTVISKLEKTWTPGYTFESSSNT